MARNRTYLDGKKDWFDYCEADTWSMLWIEDFVKQLGYGREYAKLRFYWCQTGKTLVDGLVALRGDKDMVLMIQATAQCKNLVVYIDHVRFLEMQNVDNVLADGLRPLPSVISPRKVIHLDVEGEKVPHFYAELNKQVTPKKRTRSNREPSDDDRDYSDDSDDSDLDSDFVDSDFEPDKDDDDLYHDYADKDVEDELPGDKKHSAKGKGNVVPDGDFIDDVPEEAELKLPEDEDEVQKKFNFSEFNKDVDMENPKFRVGQIFANIQMLRQALSSYCVKNRVQVKKLRNEKKRLEATCLVDGCPWYLKASLDSRSSSFLVKTYDSVHTCSRKWEVKNLTAPFLANLFVDEFRDDEKMSLKHLQVRCKGSST
ncbi:uncharacterized protein LOC112269993 [Brachypodium distachyon]|uniref:uncharacterized protein LOC112269993 n=1 Tax=Brachypodium distachyon TaxID=15368 RepID=UPI000D0DDEEF|nr:uncharacterized protein LOC112269993 [Brachypodium distachyon]|eukprot:XP_024313354.1 uncharacterized protein LOC112269993 [Brachypodium distachyon]